MLLLSEGVLLMGLIIVAFGSGFILFGGFIHYSGCCYKVLV